MCPACIASTAAVVAGAGSTGGILALCIGKFRKPTRLKKTIIIPLRGMRRWVGRYGRKVTADVNHPDVR
jgi:hypothetical protein